MYGGKRMLIIPIVIAGIIVIYFLAGIRTVRPTERGLIETMGKYSRFADQGVTWIAPFFQTLRQINITENMADAEPQEIITEDNLNAQVDLVVFYKIKPDERSVKDSVYNVNDCQEQIITLARTTARNVIGGMKFTDVNSKRKDLNQKLAKILDVETKSWGIQIVRVEMKEITPPRDVQETMNKVIKAQNEKDAAKDFATAQETQADGLKRAKIKEAEGIAKGRKIVADANAYKVKVENEAARKYFIGNAQKLKALEVTQNSLQNNSKVILTEKGIKPQIIIGKLPVN